MRTKCDYFARCRTWPTVALFVWFGIIAIMPAWSGDLDSPGGPTDPASEMFTLELIYNRLDTGAVGAKSSFAEPAAGPTVGTGHTLNEVMSKAPEINANASTTSEVLTGKTFWGLSAGGWGLLTGTMPNIGVQNIAPGATGQTISQGYHDGTGAVAGDADLVTSNIRSGVTIFGVAGNSNVVNTSSGDATAGDLTVGKKAWVDGAEVTGTRPLAPTAPLPKTGQTASYATGDDGDLEKGVAWPNPRFTDNGNGTVTDNLTGLIWLKDANAFGTRFWATALTDCATLNSGEAGLSDGSVEGDWHLPNVRELHSLIDFGRTDPALCNAAGTGQWTAGNPFTNVQSSAYWSSSALASGTSIAWSVLLLYGNVSTNAKTNVYYVWPVRAGQ